jgi:hypothetical protein
MSANPANDTAVQVNLKTQSGALINIYASNVVEAREIVEAVQEQLVAPVAALEQALVAATTVGGHVPVAPAAQQPRQAPPAAPPAQTYAAPAGVPAAPQPQGSPVCNHGEPAKLIPAGRNKAGKEWTAFYTCGRPRNEQCGFTLNADKFGA